MRFSRTGLAFFAAAVVLLLPGSSLHADVWDLGSDPDEGNGTDNAAVHGLDQVHDMATLPGPFADEDWLRLCQSANASYEAVVDGLTGDLSTATNPLLQRVTGAGTLIQDSTTAGIGDQNRSLRWEVVAPGCGAEFVRVSSPACGVACDAADQYRIRFYETTLSVPRYNNAGGQVTVLIVQNPTDYAVTGTAYLWNGSGALVTSFAISLAAKAAQVTNLAAVNGGAASGTSGTITISNNARFGDLAVKSVALEPPTGFSFDSPGLYRAH